MEPFVSVIVATRNREALLAQMLDSLAEQEWPLDRFEIVVADNGSSDGTRGVVERAALAPNTPTVKYLYVSAPGKSHAVNAAIAAASGDLLAFTDDDVLAAPGWIGALAASLAETGAGFVSGRTLPRWEATPPRWISPALHGVLAIADSGGDRLTIDRDTTHIVPVGANLAVRAEIVRRIGGLRHDLGKLDGTLRTGEDHEFFLRMLHAGYRGVYEPNAVVRHWVARERLAPGYFQRWLYQNGRDVARLQTSFPSTAVHFLGVPRYLWRDAVASLGRTVWSALRCDRAAGFAAALRVVWFAGFLREAWFGEPVPSAFEVAADGGR